MLAEKPALEGTSQGNIRVPILAPMVAIRLVILRVSQHILKQKTQQYPRSAGKIAISPWAGSRWIGDDTTALQNQKGYVTGLSGPSDKKPMAGVGCVAIRYWYTHVLLV